MWPCMKTPIPTPMAVATSMPMRGFGRESMGVRLRTSLSCRLLPVALLPSRRTRGKGGVREVALSPADKPTAGTGKRTVSHASVGSASDGGLVRSKKK
jgi:hypothetical protein